MREPVRVLYEIHPHTLGGTERFLARFIPRLDRRRYEPVVVSQNRGLPLQTIHALGVRTESVEDYFSESGIRRLADFIRVHRIRLVQSNYYASQLALAASLAGVPHVWRLGGHVDYGSGVRNPAEAAWALKIIRLLSQEIVCNSKYVRSQFPGRSKTPPIRVIPNGILLPPRAHLTNNGPGIRVGMVAHFTPQKRHVDFIRAAEVVSENLVDASFAIVGCEYANAASRSYAAEVRRRAQNLIRAGKLTVSEHLGPRADVTSRFDVVVLPSVGESFSNAILEAMAAGVPVIAARSGGNAELVEHGRTGLLVPPLRPEALARAITRLTRKPELLMQMGLAARARARALFSLADCVKAYEAVYSKAISTRP